MQPRARADTLAPTALARSAAPRHALPSSQQRAKQPPPRPAGQELAAAAARQPCAVQRRPSHPGSPPGPWSSALSSTSSCRHPQPRHVALQATVGRFAGKLIPGRRKPTWPRYKKGPRAPLSTHAPSGYPHGTPIARNRPGNVVFLISGNHGRHHCPGQFGTTRASHSSFSPPRTPSSSRKPSPYSISIENHRRPETTLHRNLPPPRSSPPTTSSTTVDPSTTGRNAPAVRIHPRPPEAARSRRSPALVAGVPPPPGTEEEGGGRTGQT